MTLMLTASKTHWKIHMFLPKFKNVFVPHVTTDNIYIFLLYMNVLKINIHIYF